MEEVEACRCIPVGNGFRLAPPEDVQRTATERPSNFHSNTTSGGGVGRFNTLRLTVRPHTQGGLSSVQIMTTSSTSKRECTLMRFHVSLGQPYQCKYDHSLPHHGSPAHASVHLAVALTSTHTCTHRDAHKHTHTHKHTSTHTKTTKTRHSWSAVSDTM